jgi:hypothetical protein
MTTIADIERLVRDYADAHGGLAARMATIRDQTRELHREGRPAIRRGATGCARAYERLRAAIDSSRSLFKRPRTHIFDGVRVGLVKGKGKLAWDDDAVTVRLIRRLFPDQTEMLIHVVEKPSRTGLAMLTAAELKRLGVTVQGDGDEVLIKPADLGVDKLVADFLKKAEETEA